MMNHVTEAPWSFHIMAALAVLGSVFGRQLALPWADYVIYAPMHVMWVGPSGSGKTQAFNTALQAVRSARPTLEVIKNEATRQGLLYRVGSSMEHVRALATQGKVPAPTEFVFAAGEMSTIINRSKESDGMVPMLTDMMDNPREYERTTAGRGHDYVFMPTPTLMCCSTSHWLVQNMPAGVFEGGFMSRILPIVAPGKARTLAKPKLLTEKDRVLMGISAMRLRDDIGTREYEITGPVFEWYRDWYEDLHESTTHDARTEGWRARAHTHLLRIAMLLSASRAGASITVGDLALAKRVLGIVEPGIESLMRLGGLSAFGSWRQQVLTIVRQARERGVTRAHVLKQVPCSRNELDLVLETLLDAEEIGKGKGLKPVFTARLTNNTKKRGKRRGT
jgi:hypothetical protein